MKGFERLIIKGFNLENLKESVFDDKFKEN